MNYRARDRKRGVKRSRVSAVFELPIYFQALFLVIGLVWALTQPTPARYT